MLKFSQIGVGYWGPNLLRNIINNKKCEVISVVDASKERRDFVQNLYPSVNVYKQAEKIYNDSSVDGVIIATPAKTHYDIAMKCLSSGKHVLIEKPMAKTVKEVQEIGKLAKKNNLIAMVGHTFLYNPAVIHIKKIIDSGELGDIRYIYSQRLNLGRIRNDVDALWNLAPHDISIIQYWLDEPEPQKINRIGMDYVQEGIDDVVFLNIEYPKNIIAHIHVSWLDPHKIRKMTVVGSRKMIVYDDIAKNKIVIFDKGIDKMAILGKNMDFDDPNTFSFDYRSGDVSIPNFKWVEPLNNEINHFIDCINNVSSCKTDSLHAEKVVEILSAK